MFNVRQISDDFYYVGGNDRRLELFENAYLVLRQEKVPVKLKFLY